jgi:hypothetical protein
MLTRRAASVAILPFLAACSGTMNSGDLASGGGRGGIFPISAEEADRAMASAMLEEFPSSPIGSVALPHKGYNVTISYLLDSHRISLVAVPAMGLNAEGQRVQGFAFEVTHRGTMPITGAPRATSVFERVNRHAAALRGPLRSS